MYECELYTATLAQMHTHTHTIAGEYIELTYTNNTHTDTQTDKSFIGSYILSARLQYTYIYIVMNQRRTTGQQFSYLEKISKIKKKFDFLKS